MKKLKKLVLAVCIAAVGIMTLTGCSGKEENKTGETTENKKTEEGFYLEANGVKVTLNTKADSIINALGKYNKFSETPSCAFQGNDKIYSYSAFDVYTNEFDGEDYITSIVIKSDLVSTPEGIEIGSTSSKVTECYGSDFEEVSGVRTYKKGSTKLIIAIENDAVASIEYLAIR